MVKPNYSPDNFSLTAVGGKNFFLYLKNLNLLKDRDLLILSTSSHFYYDENELKNVRTLINLKKLNLIKDLDTFLRTVFQVLPANANFIGCFSESETHNFSEFFSGLTSRFNNLLDSRTDRTMNKQDVTKLLEKYGFKVVDMTEMNGLTFFYSQNLRQPVEFRA
jgi:hypothetical protein